MKGDLVAALSAGVRIGFEIITAATIALDDALPTAITPARPGA